MYQLVNTSTGINMVLKTEYRIWIPFDPANTDYQEYLKWVAEGNTPQPAE